MKVRAIQIFTLIFLVLLGATQCKKRSEIFRLIDDFDESNIVASPFKSLEDKTVRIEQNWAPDEMTALDWENREGVPFEIPEGIQVFAIPTEKHLLNWERKIHPEEMEVFLDGNLIEFSSKVQTDSVNWRWARLEREVEPEEYKKWYKVFKDVIVLDRDKWYTQEFFFPGGEVVFELKAQSAEPFNYHPHLFLLVDDVPIKPIKVGKDGRYWLTHDIDTGMHIIKFGFYDVTLRNPPEREKRVFIDSIRIKSQNDVILISVPQNEIEKFQRSKCKAIYLSSEDRKIFHEDDPLKPLEHQEYMEKKVQLVEGITYLDVICSSNDKDVYIQVWLNEEEVGNHKVLPVEEASYRFEISATGGMYDLRLQMKYWPDEEAAPVNEPELFIHRFFLKTPFEETYLPLIRLKNRFLLNDLGIGDNPYQIKKKIREGENSVNCLLAPSNSEYVFDVNVQLNSVLQFGCGLLERTWQAIGDGVIFSIIIEKGKKQETVFVQHLNPQTSQGIENIISRELDLSAFAGKKVKIRFIAETPQGKIDKRNDLSFWYDPVLLQKPRQDKTNVILISLDTLRADHLGCYGYDLETSPNLDAFAQDSVLFRNCYAQAPYTITSHVSMLTSLWPANHGTYATQYHKMSPINPTLADIMRVNDYLTCAFTGGGAMSAFFGYSKGFDFYNERRENVQGDTAEKLFDLSADWIQQHHNRSFFLFIHTYQIHTPYDPPPPYDTMFTAENAPYRRSSDIKEFRGWWGTVSDETRQNTIDLYNGEIRYTDEALIGPLMGLLRRLDLYDSTMIIITSDHGEEFFEHNGFGHSHSLYNELIRVPLMIKYPKNKHEGIIRDPVIRIIDIMPTVFDELGIDYTDDLFDGTNLLNVINDNNTQDRIFFSEIKYQDELPDKVASNIDGFKLILNEDYSEEQIENYVAPPPAQEKEELYNMKGDFKEQNNIASQNQTLIGKITRQIFNYFQQARQGKEEAGQQELDEKIKEQLKALGYIK